MNLYTDKAKGILSEQRFVKLTAAMEREQEENQKQLKELALSLHRSNEQESDVRIFIRENPAVCYDTGTNSMPLKARNTGKSIREL